MTVAEKSPSGHICFGSPSINRKEENSDVQISVIPRELSIINHVVPSCPVVPSIQSASGLGSVNTSVLSKLKYPSSSSNTTRNHLSRRTSYSSAAEQSRVIQPTVQLWVSLNIAKTPSNGTGRRLSPFNGSTKDVVGPVMTSASGSDSSRRVALLQSF